MRVVDGSRLLASIDAIVSRLEAAFSSSATRRAVTSAWTTATGGDPTHAVAVVAIAIGVAMTVHILLDRFAQPYPFPSRAELIVPASVLALSLLTVLMRRAVVRAWRNRGVR